VGGAAQYLLPITHRNASSAVSFVAGQCKGLTDQNWAGLAGKDRTLVIYMGVATAADIVEKLIADGLSPETPVAVIERATRSGGRAIRTLLADLGELITREGVKSPAIIIVGDVVLKSNAEDGLRAIALKAEKRV
jgi:uroporphyrin-III C-methyltransferase